MQVDTYINYTEIQQLTVNKSFGGGKEIMELNLLINIFKKKPGNIPPWAGDAQAQAVGSGKGKGRQNRDIFCPKV